MVSMTLLAGQIYKGISEIEVFWVALAVFGLAFSLFNVKEAWKDVRALDLVGIKNGRRIIAKTQRFQDGCRAICHAIFLAIGIGSWTLMDTPFDNQPWNVILITVLIRWGLIAAAGILVAQSYASFHLRRTILQQEKYDMSVAELTAKIEENFISKADAATELEGKADDLRSSITE